MADSTVNDLTAASTLDGTELLYGVQGGADRRVTVAQVRAGLLPLTGGAMSGNIVLAGAPSQALHPASKTYVDDGLAAKAASSHAHATSDVTGLDAALAGKAAASHTHVAANVSDFSEAVDDRVNALLVEGTGITLTYDDNAGTLTVDAAGGGGYAKLTASGVNGGIFTFFDDTADTGVTKVNIRAGASQAANALATFFANDGTTARFTFGSTGILTATLDAAVNDFALKVGRAGATSAVSLGDKGYGAGGEIAAAISGTTTVVVTAGSGLEFGNALTLRWSSDGGIFGAYDLGLARSAAGILKVTDGSTGYGRLLAGTLAVNNSAAGSTPGACVKKIEVFDVAGASLGFVAVYDAIT